MEDLDFEKQEKQARRFEIKANNAFDKLKNGNGKVLLKHGQVCVAFFKGLSEKKVNELINTEFKKISTPAKDFLDNNHNSMFYELFDEVSQQNLKGVIIGSPSAIRVVIMQLKIEPVILVLSLEKIKASVWGFLYYYIIDFF